MSTYEQLQELKVRNAELERENAELRAKLPPKPQPGTLTIGRQLGKRLDAVLSKFAETRYYKKSTIRTFFYDRIKQKYNISGISYLTEEHLAEALADLNDFEQYLRGWLPLKSEEAA